jgi:hypothetical protein
VTGARLLRPSALALTLAIVACTPALNWREVRLDGLTALLPCKPDQAQRSVRLGATDIQMDMVGCEAADALYAISHVRAQDATHAAGLLSEWRAVTLANLHATSVQPHAFNFAKVTEGAYQVPSGATVAAHNGEWKLLWVQGQRPDASAVQARLAWFALGVDVYHVAVYGAQLGPQMVDMLYSDLRLQ